ncbi:hypothetical protein M426DRAFT_72206 [Hypoxylon sp. CI-4A]|nr:hypothetical protein M426DRAFT_72206 [Hypoxylon sp. CI-4A]
MARKNHSFYLAEHPQGEIIPGRTFNYVETDAPTANDLKDGQVLVEVLYMSLDPATRTFLYDRPFPWQVKIGDVMRGFAISRVLASKSSKGKEGDLTFSPIGWTEVAILNESELNLVEVPKGMKLTTTMGAAGPTGVTAYIGMKHIGQPKPGDTVVVSGAAGATGLMAGQIAKIKGARVVGIAGSDEKCEMLVNELGFDVALNYKKPSFEEDFVKATPNKINVYWDNVGGRILDKAIEQAAKHARFVICGSITDYNNLDSTSAVHNMFLVILNSIRMEGFQLSDYGDEYAEGVKQLVEWISEGKIKPKETMVKGGLKVADSAINQLFSGGNTGKLILEVKPYEEVSLV